MFVMTKSGTSCWPMFMVSILFSSIHRNIFLCVYRVAYRRNPAIGLDMAELNGCCIVYITFPK